MMLDLLVSMAEDDGAESVELCVDPSHEVRDDRCVSCGMVHLPTLAARPYCGCEVPDLEIRVGESGRRVGLSGWRCHACGLPNKNALRGLPAGKSSGTIQV